MCEVNENKACISFLKGKIRDKYGNNTYLMRAGHYCPWHVKWYTSALDKKMYLKVKSFLEKKDCVLTEYKKDKGYGDYVDIRAKGLALIISDNEFIVFEK